MITALLIIGLIVTGILIQKTADYLDNRFVSRRQQELIQNDSPESAFNLQQRDFTARED